MEILKNYIKLIRPGHWTKNLLVFAPLFFARSLLDVQSASGGVLLFIAFCLLAGCVYIINDIFDIEQDRQHIHKKNRPLAAGKISIRNAILYALVLFTGSIFISFYLPIKAVIIIYIYLVTNIFYSFKLKHIPLLDIFVVACMYLMRIYAGATFWKDGLSHWLILCTFFISLFLIVGKRRAEFCAFGEDSMKTRMVMQFYNKDFLSHMLTIALTASLTSYSIYVIAANTPYLLYSIFFVAFGLFRYLYVIYQHNTGHAPEKVLFADKWILGSVSGWIVFNTIILYL